MDFEMDLEMPEIEVEFDMPDIEVEAPVTAVDVEMEMDSRSCRSNRSTSRRNRSGSSRT